MIERKTVIVRKTERETEGEGGRERQRRRKEHRGSESQGEGKLSGNSAFSFVFALRFVNKTGHVISHRSLKKQKV